MKDNKKNLLRFTGWFFLGNAALFWLIGIKYLIVMLSSKTLFATSFYSYNTLAGKCFVLLFIFISYLGHLALLAFSPALFIVPLVFLFNTRSLVFSIAVLTGALSILILIAIVLYFRFIIFILIPVLNIAFGERYGLLIF